MSMLAKTRFSSQDTFQEGQVVVAVESGHPARGREAWTGLVGLLKDAQDAGVVGWQLHVVLDDLFDELAEWR